MIMRNKANSHSIDTSGIFICQDWHRLIPVFLIFKCHYHISSNQ